MQSLQKEIVKTFFQTLEDIKTKRDFEIFFSDFLTPKELEIFSKRLAVAYWLKKGRNYENIKNNLKVSTRTISEVKKLMDTPGIKLALKKMEAEEWANVWSEKIKKLV
ncbi:hypothetical protein A2130_02555 [Candidatus Woesebacteria bacterium GWC2_33_12]|uniref:TrpR like protein, YerC/YecD n=1 Tax=Candidatus Woesebacteria bacterium GW2011_GWB1_33_22 TaxID=1618566 RepID=A0A0F9ZJ01_9BACT|nr:MAG: TrpR like protein, YerC/YecD [Candidatus Woesebacteria bacterium GW2011_GWC2_33_12]KKP41696.1 MAG: TrpR like protein, YerC/YecD [Candidatus Woesebacteria bacterium GW2011_GWA2_33_20]KKP44168.1 MAG: TrpR like protein, YerC/YecD [Candidatus Woesebacteria bacterium GW2011_GWB1_33_22]KKP45827.1 MAG: TrpR like protein, YerC/YecD [Microgenomates group bacterium GW2011_GWC1_33_28]KKP50249.1 MAG: TrpR like protein, YerC/YecD [Candidatus Woesebacteria bacterium GW2011_GWA1_33_33]OGM07316.1 MAG: